MFHIYIFLLFHLVVEKNKKKRDKKKKKKKKEEEKIKQQAPPVKFFRLNKNCHNIQASVVSHAGGSTVRKMVLFEDVFEARRPIRPKSARAAVSSAGSAQRRTKYATRGNVNNISPVSSSQWVEDTIKTALKERKRSGHLGAIKVFDTRIGAKKF